MRRLAAVLLVVSFAASGAFAGTISFVQTSPDPFNDSGLGDTTATFDVYVDSTTFPGGFTAMTVGIGSNDLPILPAPAGMALDSAFRSAFTFIAVDNPGPGNFTYDVLIDGFGFGAKIPAPVLVGELVVDAAGVGAGDYQIMVAPGSELGNYNSPGARDLMTLGTGSGPLTVIPEPATISLLGLAAVGLVRRRRS